MASLYRRHRPRTFADVVGQEHVVRTLSNAILQGKVHHAYLFVGSRGTGKTSMAKILASCLNCEQGPTIEPCGRCESCVAIASATSLDVVEMDAASNNSVDDIRDLRERVGYAPVSGRSKVYILDEAHMLSTQAWNAFLKTLEEPPPHTIFVLATTEANKVIPTVVDRCHRFDFARPAVEEIAAVLDRVAAQEQIAIPPEAVAAIARSAAGSFRDALGTLEQLVTYSEGGRIELDDVLAVLGVADADLLFDALDAVAAHDSRAALLAVGRLAQSGRDVARFFRDLEAHARELMVVQTLGGEVPGSLRVTPERDARLADQAARLAGIDAMRVLELLAAGLRNVHDGGDARVQLELALLKAAQPEIDPATRALLSRIERLEARLGGGGPPAAGEPGAPPAVEAAPFAPSAAAAPAPGSGPTPGPGRQSGPDPEARPAAAAVHGGGPEPERERDPAPHPEGRPAAAPADGAGTELDLDAVVEVWPAVVESVVSEHPLLGAFVARARPVACSGATLTLALGAGDDFSKRKVEEPANRAAVCGALRALTGAGVSLRYELREDVAPPDPAPAAPAPSAPSPSPSGPETPAAPATPAQHGATGAAPTEQATAPEDWVDRFKEAFDAEEISAQADGAPDPSTTEGEHESG